VSTAAWLQVENAPRLVAGMLPGGGAGHAGDGGAGLLPLLLQAGQGRHHGQESVPGQYFIYILNNVSMLPCKGEKIRAVFSSISVCIINNTFKTLFFSMNPDDILNQE